MMRVETKMIETDFVQSNILCLSYLHYEAYILNFRILKSLKMLIYTQTYFVLNFRILKPIFM